MKQLVLAIVLAVSVSSAASADIRNLRTDGYWSAYAGRSNNGVPICGMSANDNIRSVHIKYYEGQPVLTVQVFKQGWRIPAGTYLKVRVGFDSWTAGEAVALGGPGIGTTGGYIEFNIANSFITDFMKAVQDARQMWIMFPDGNESTWFASMDGSRTVGQTFARCAIEVERTYKSQTQPYGNAPSATQPFGAPGFEPDRPAPATPFDEKNRV